MTNVFGYNVTIKDDDDFLCDRGIVFANSLQEATTKVFDSWENGSEEVVQIEVYELEPNYDDVHSFYAILADTNISKEVLKYELENWYLI